MARSVRAKPEMDRVLYFDPYQDSYEHLIAGFSKHFKYAYQNEVRMIWRLKSGTAPKELFIEAGTLSDIAELVRTA
jgi:hypothetical protein